MRAAEAQLFDAGIAEWDLMQRAGQGAADWIMLALIPIAGVVLAAVTARLTVLAALRKML